MVEAELYEHFCGTNGLYFGRFPSRGARGGVIRVYEHAGDEDCGGAGAVRTLVLIC